MEKERLTNEKLRQKSKSQFELVNYAIKLAEHFIKSGREPQVHSGLKNPALQVLAEIAANQDCLEDLPEIVYEEEMPTKYGVNGREPKEPPSAYTKGNDRKKSKSRIDSW